MHPAAHTSTAVSTIFFVLVLFSAVISTCSVPGPIPLSAFLLLPVSIGHAESKGFPQKNPPRNTAWNPEMQTAEKPDSHHQCILSVQNRSRSEFHHCHEIDDRPSAVRQQFCAEYAEQDQIDYQIQTQYHKQCMPCASICLFFF